MQKLFQGILTSASIVFIPTIGNISILHAPHMWILFTLGILASILQPSYHVLHDKSDTLDKGTEIQIIWSVYITQTLSVLEATYIRYPSSIRWDMISTATLMIMLFGLGLRTWAVFILGKYYTMHLTVFDDHKLIRNGPYKYLRHPAYVGAFLLYVGTPVFLHTWYSFIFSLIVLSVAWIRRILSEEQLLTEYLGNQYEEFSKSVPRFIPHFWK